MDAFDKQKIAEIVAREIAKSSITPVFDLSLEKSCELIDSVLAEAKRIVESGEIGRLRGVHADFCYSWKLGFVLEKFL